MKIRPQGEYVDAISNVLDGLVEDRFGPCEEEGLVNVEGSLAKSDLDTLENLMMLLSQYAFIIGERIDR